MEIQLTAKQMKVTSALREYVQQKMDKAQKYFDHIVWGQAILSVEKRTHKAEMIIHAPGQTFRSLSAAADLYSAIDLASDKIDSQLKKYKEKLKVRHKAKASEVTAIDTIPVSASSFSVIRQPVAPMNPESAVQLMENSGQTFLAYLDQSTDQIHVVFRRSNDTYGIVQPVRKNKR